MELVRQQQNGPVVLGGHSSGGGTVIRYAGGENNTAVDSFLMLAPYIHHTAPTYSNESTWSNVNTPRMAGLSILKFFDITAFNDENAISFNMPTQARNSTETLLYSYTVQTSMHLRGDYDNDIAEHPPLITVDVLANASHFELVTQEVDQRD